MEDGRAHLARVRAKKVEEMGRELVGLDESSSTQLYRHDKIHSGVI
jgi:hypothetical protein